MEQLPADIPGPSDEHAGGAAAERTRSPATQVAWEVRAHLLQHDSSERGSEQAAQAFEKAQQGFTELWQLTSPYLLTKALRRTGGDVNAAHDILQETYLRAWRYLPKFRGDSNVETWLYSIMFGRLSDYYAKSAKQKPLHFEKLVEKEDSLLFKGSLPTIESVSELLDNQALITEVLQKAGLTRSQRMLLAARHMIGMGEAELARLVGKTEGAAKVDLSRGLKKARIYLQERRQQHD